MIIGNDNIPLHVVIDVRTLVVTQVLVGQVCVPCLDFESVRSIQPP